mgnify:CR=1 FL=1
MGELGGKIRRDDDAHLDPSTVEEAVHFFEALSRVRDVEVFARGEGREEVPALFGEGLVENGGGLVFHVGVNGVAEEDDLYDGQEKHNEKRQRVAPHLDGFFPQYGQKAGHGITSDCRNK